MNQETHFAFAEAERLVEAVLVRRERIGYVPKTWRELRGSKDNLAAAA